MALDTTHAPSATSPLWIIALFIALSEVMAGAAAIATDGATRIIFAIFAVAFPPFVFGVFVWLIINHAQNLYSPAQYKTEASPSEYAAALAPSTPIALTTMDLKLLGRAATTASMAVNGDLDVHRDSKMLSDVESEFERAVEAESVTVDLNEFGLGVVQVPVSDNTTVDAFLDSLYFKMQPRVNAFSYNDSWVLVDSGGRQLTELGTDWARDTLKIPRDTRRLSTIHIGPGTQLIARPIRPVSG